MLQLEWKNPDVEGLIEFLVKEKGFKYVVSLRARHALFISSTNLYPLGFPLSSEERVRAGAAKLQKHLNTKQQGRLDGFFTAKPKDKPAPAATGKGKGKADAKGKGGSGTKRKVRFFLLVYTLQARWGAMLMLWPFFFS